MVLEIDVCGCAQGARVITAAQLAENNGLGGRPLWVSLYGNVYDLTSFADDHPGGRGPIDAVAGKDGTVSFAGVHTQSMLEDFEAIGKSE